MTNRGVNNPVWLVAGLLLLTGCWWALWTLRSYWNPLFFFGLWTGAILVARTLAGERPLDLRRHLALSALSVPAWWWFELLNHFLDNWEYHSVVAYSPLEYNLLATLAFSTVVPALDAAWAVARRIAPPHEAAAPPPAGRWLIGQALVGLTGQALMFLLPHYFYAWAWLAPFLLLDAAVAALGGRGLARDLWLRRWDVAVPVGLAGMACGFCWELWNVAAMPKWTYQVPFVDFLRVFEMPLLGYLGYIPFSWAIFQLVQLAGLGVRAAISSSGDRIDELSQHPV